MLLPVSSSPGRRLAPQLGDDAIEILFNAHSSCCTFEAAVVIIRVRTAVAIIYTGGVNTLNHAQLARLSAQAASRLAGAT